MNNEDQKYIIKPESVISFRKENFIKKIIAFKINEYGVIKGEIIWGGKINDTEEAYGIKTDYSFEGGTDGVFNNMDIFKCDNKCGVLVRKSFDYIELDRDGTVKNAYIKDMKEAKSSKTFSNGECVSVKIGNQIEYGKIAKAVQINNIFCYEIQLSKYPSYGSKSPVLVIENDIQNDKVEDPKSLGVHTYYRIGAFVLINKRTEGTVRKYIAGNNVFYYLVETDTEVIRVGLKNIAHGFDLGLNNKGFKTIDDPENYGIVTSLKKGSVVQILKPEPHGKKVLHGHISWMGFDGDQVFKFGISLEEQCGTSDGNFCGSKLFKAESGYADLVDASEVAPDGRFPQEEKRSSVPKYTSKIEESYQNIPYRIGIGEYKGIQGNLNSCYLDTSLFAMFAFNRFLDNIITETVSEINKDTKELQLVLRKNIVYPLRKHHYVAYDKVAEFRNQLQKVFPNSKFIMNERDPEELIENLLHVLTPNRYLLKTRKIGEEYEQKCLLTQLFYQHDSGKRSLNVLEMLSLTFLEMEILISKPPKGLILQLPRHGRDLKRFKTVKILPKIDITPFIAICSKKCEKCKKNVTETNLCIKCSMKSYKLVYYCNEHKDQCKHIDIKSLKVNSDYDGQVELELIAILCIERTHYIAYTKTNEIDGKWIYFNSMEKLEKEEFIPLVRETKLDYYFRNECSQLKDDDIFQSDVAKIENYAFVCFYKNPTMEMYDEDFNSDTF